MSRSVSVDFPAPGAPVSPVVHALPVFGEQFGEHLIAGCATVLDERDQPSQRPPVAVASTCDEHVGIIDTGHAARG